MVKLLARFDVEVGKTQNRIMEGEEANARMVEEEETIEGRIDALRARVSAEAVAATAKQRDAALRAVDKDGFTLAQLNEDIQAAHALRSALNRRMRMYRPAAAEPQTHATAETHATAAHTSRDFFDADESASGSNFVSAIMNINAAAKPRNTVCSAAMRDAKEKAAAANNGCGTTANNAARTHMALETPLLLSTAAVARPSGTLCAKTDMRAIRPSSGDFA